MTTRVPDPVDNAYADPLEPQELFSDEAELQWVLVPVTPHDHARRQRRMKMLGFGICVVLVALAAWLYKRQVDPIRALEAFDAGERLLRSARYSQAIASFDRAIALRPDYADAFLMRGRASVAQGRPLTAIPDFTKVVDARPRDPIALLDRGSAQLEVQEFAKALSDFTRAIELDPSLDKAYNLRGITLRVMGQPQKALEDLNRAVALRETMDNLFQRAATNQILGEHEKAIADLNQVIGYQPNSSQAYFARSLSYRALGDNAAADKDHEAGRALDGR
jgi:tetratricopeptide (TPR) repeat protein